MTDDAVVCGLVLSSSWPPGSKETRAPSDNSHDGGSSPADFSVQRSPFASWERISEVDGFSPGVESTGLCVDRRRGISSSSSPTARGCVDREGANSRCRTSSNSWTSVRLTAPAQPSARASARVELRPGRAGAAPLAAAWRRWGLGQDARSRYGGREWL